MTVGSGNFEPAAARPLTQSLPIDALLSLDFAKDIEGSMLISADPESSY